MSRIALLALIFAAATVAGLALGGSVFDILVATLGFLLFIDVVHAVVKRRLKWRHLLLFALVGGKIFWVNRFIVSNDELTHGGSRQDLLSRRDYLLQRVVTDRFGPLDSPAFFQDVMQEEWAIGTLSMLGAALANLSFEFPDTREQHLKIVDTLIRRMLEPDIRIYEQRWWNEDALDSHDGSNGHIGYLGHLNLLLAIHQVLGGGAEHAELFGKVSAALARRILASPSRYLETFPGQIFIPDNAVVVASLSLYDLIEGAGGRPQAMHSAVAAWLEATRTKLLDGETGLIVPWLDTAGQPLGYPRASYSSWNVFYLLQIDRAFADDQSRKIRERLLVRPLSRFCALTEYLPGHPGVADVDSGPVIFGLSTSGSGFALSVARTLGDNEMLGCLLGTAELVGSTYAGPSGRSYLAAPLIGDAIVLAMRTAVTWDEQFVKPQ